MREFLSLCLAGLISLQGVPLAAATGAAAQNPASSASLSQLIERDYVYLFENVPELNIPAKAIESFRKELEKEKEREKKSLEQKKDRMEREIDQAQDELKQLHKRSEQSPEVEERRHTLHCKIQNLRKELAELKLSLEQGLDVRYENKLAKLRILGEWPARYREIQKLLEEGKAPMEKFADFRDVGFRGGVFEGQEKDVEKGREAIEEMRRQQILPPEVEDEEVVEYVRALANRIGRHSDLRVPLNVTVLRSKEINAFALPGGFLFINSALIEKAEKESELAGVIAHEIAHVTARHGDRLMSKANIANIIFQAAQLAAVIFTGGVASIGTYYALQYGFYGLGMVLSLSLLGVSRDYEIEADLLGTQYLWHAGYDTRGFISFFAKMAEEKGYVTGLSWFRTHPPFYERMEKTYEEILYLPEQEEPIVDTEQFRNVKARIARIAKEMEREDREAPTLRRVYECEDQKRP